MKVAFDARSLCSTTPRGWDRYTLELLSRLPEYGVEPWLVYEDGRPISRAHAAVADYPTIPIGSRGIEWEQVSLPRVLRRLKFDAYHAPAERGVPLAAPCPAVLTIHSLTHHSYRSLIRKGLLTGSMQDYVVQAGSRRTFYEFYSEAQHRAADHVLVPSEFCREELLSLLRLPTSKVTVTPLGLPQAFTQPRRDSHTSEVLSRLGIQQPYILYVGGYERHKNVVGLLDVAALVRTRIQNLSFVLVGTNQVPEELRQHPGAHSGVRFLCNLTDDLVPLYDGATAMLTMSWRESFCLPALEAMSRGIPVVASRWGAVGEVLGDTGALIDPRSAAEAADAVVRIVERPVDSDALRRRALTFTWDAAVKQTAELYFQLRESWEGKARLGRLAARAQGILHAAANAVRGFAAE